MRRLALALALTLATIPASAQSIQDQLEIAARAIAEAQRLAGPRVVALQPTTAQAQLDTAVPGSIIELQAGVTYPSLAVRTDGLTLTSANYVVQALPTNLVGMATIAGTLDVHAANVMVQGLAIGGVNTNQIVNCSETATNVTFDNIVVYGHPTLGAKNGIMLNCAGVLLTRYIVRDIFRVGQESHGVTGWNGPGPYAITDGYINGGSIGIFFGGADPTTPDMIPTDITIQRNVVTVDPAWKGRGYAIKNRIEIKNGRNVLSESNVYENSFVDGQIGYGMMVAVRNQNGQCPWCTVDGFTSVNDTIRSVAGGVSILTSDDRAANLTVPARNLTFRGLRIENMSAFPGNGRVIYYSPGAHGDVNSLVFDDVQVVNKSGTITTMFQFAAGSRVGGLVVRNVKFFEGHYGAIGDGGPGVGILALNFFAPGYVWENVTVIKDVRARTINWPAGTILQ